MTETEVRSPTFRAWLSYRRLAALRLRVDVTGTSRIPTRRAGEIVLASWSPGIRPLAKGWMIQDIGFLCILNEPNVEVIVAP
jgi:hypothetical protein